MLVYLVLLHPLHVHALPSSHTEAEAAPQPGVPSPRPGFSQPKPQGDGPAVSVASKGGGERRRNDEVSALHAKCDCECSAWGYPAVVAYLAPDAPPDAAVGGRTTSHAEMAASAVLEGRPVPAPARSQRHLPRSAPASPRLAPLASVKTSWATALPPTCPSPADELGVCRHVPHDVGITASATSAALSRSAPAKRWLPPSNPAPDPKAPVPRDRGQPALVRRHVARTSTQPGHPWIAFVD